MQVERFIDHYLPSRGNSRGAWQRQWRRDKETRDVVWVAMRGPLIRIDLPCVVTFTRNYRANPMDTDNLAATFKAARDEMAELLGCDDAPGSPVEWYYAQTKARENGFAILVEEVE